MTTADTSFWTTWTQPIIITIVGTVLAGIALSLLALLFEATAPFGRKVLGFLWRLVSLPFHARLTTDRRLEAKLAAARANGRASLQSEMDAARVRPIAKASWVVRRDKKGSTADFLLFNVAENSVAQDVTVTCSPSEFTMMSGAFWEEVSGRTLQGFQGRPTQDGRMIGVTFNVEWTDANGDRTSAIALLPGTL